MSSVGIESILTSKNMEVSYFNPVCEESSSLTAKEEKALPGICSPSEEEKINGEVEKAGELLKEELVEDTKLGRNSSKVTNGVSQDSTNADVKYLRKGNHNFAVTLGEAKIILGTKIRGRTRSQDRSRSLKRKSAIMSKDVQRQQLGNAALKRKKR